MGDNSNCDVCRNRSNNNKDNIVKCKKCDYKAQKNGYCGKHQKYSKMENIEEDKKVCSNFNRGCTNLLGINSPYSKCDQCREKGRDGYMKRKMKNNVIIIDDDGDDGDNDDIDDIDDDKVCTRCYRKASVKYFIGKDGNIKKTCNVCRAHFKKQDDKRKGRKRIDTRDPEVRQKWKDNNRDKSAGYYMNYRQREIKKDKNKYRKKNAAKHKK